MPIRRHGRGWEVRLQHGGRRLSRTVATRQDALQLEAKLKGRIYDARAGRIPAYGLEEALARWLTGEASALRSHANLVNKVRAMYPHVQGRQLAEVAEVAEAVKSAGLKAGLKVATINRRLAILRRVARLAFRQWDWLDRDLGAKVKLLPGEEERRVQLSPEQAKALILAAGPRIGAVVEFAALTGLRKGEILALTPECFRDGAVVVLHSKTGRPRQVPLQDGLGKRFPHGLTEKELDQGWRAARARAGLAWLQFRDLRRTFGSWIVQRTGSLKAAQDLLGHTSSAITSRHYAHLLDGNLRAAVGTLPNLAGLARGSGKRKKHA